MLNVHKHVEMSKKWLMSNSTSTNSVSGKHKIIQDMRFNYHDLFIYNDCISVKLIQTSLNFTVSQKSNT